MLVAQISLLLMLNKVNKISYLIEKKMKENIAGFYILLSNFYSKYPLISFLYLKYILFQSFLYDNFPSLFTNQSFNSEANKLQSTLYLSKMADDKRSLLQDAEENDDLTPEQLSGDQNAEKSILLSDVKGGKANFLLSVTTIMKTVIGAGILSLPLTVSRLGYVLSLIVFIFVIIIIQYSIILLLKSKNLSKHSNYSTIMFHIFKNKFGQLICSVMILINNTGICIIQMLILKGSIGKIIKEFASTQQQQKFYSSPVFIILIAALFQIPFTLVSKIQKLRFMAFIGISGISIFIITFTIVFFVLLGESKRNWSCSHQMVPVGNNFLQIIKVIPNMILALAYSMNFFPIYKGMKNARDQKMSKASLVGVSACSLFYILVGNMGYCLFGNGLQGNFLLAFNADELNDVAYFIMNISFLISVFFSFPIMFFGARNNFIAIANVLLSKIKKKQERIETTQGNIQEVSSYLETENKIKRKRQSKMLFIAFTIVLYGFIIAIAASVDDIESVFNIIGAISANSISFIFPCLFYVMLIRKKNKEKSLNYYISFALFCFFIPFGIFSVISGFIPSNHQI